MTIAKVDATANDVPDEIQGFPTIKLYPAGKKESPVEYGGSRTVEDLANFIRDNGSHKIDGLDGGADAPAAASASADKKKDAKKSKEDDPIARATEGMPKQAAAATEKASESAKGAAGKVAEKVKNAAEVVMDAVNDDGSMPDHSEL